MDVDTQLADLPSEDFATDFELAFYETQNAHEKTENNSNGGDEASIYIDRNAGAKPLSPWLTQSAVPSMVPMQSYPLDQIAGPLFDLVEQEIKEVEVFRNVHLVADPEVNGHATDTTKVEDELDSDLPSQLYYEILQIDTPCCPLILLAALQRPTAIELKGSPVNESK